MFSMISASNIHVCVGHVPGRFYSSLCWSFTCLGSVRLWTHCAPRLLGTVIQNLPLPARSREAALLPLLDWGDWRSLVWLVSVWRTPVWLLWGSFTWCWPTVTRWWHNSNNTDPYNDPADVQPTNQMVHLKVLSQYIDVQIRGISEDVIFTPFITTLGNSTAIASVAWCRLCWPGISLSFLVEIVVDTSVLLYFLILIVQTAIQHF